MSRTDRQEQLDLSQCRDEWDTLLYARGEMSPAQCADFEERLDDSEQLRRELARVERTVEIVLDLPDREPTRDLVSGVLQGLRRNPPQLRVVAPPRRAFSRWTAIAHVAALLFVAVGLWSLIWHFNSDQTPPATGNDSSATLARQRHDTAASAIEWLLDSQEPDGSWDPRKWQGQEQYRVGLTALAASALTRYAKAIDSERVAPPLNRAVAYLTTRQNPDGSFGPTGEATMYNHGLASVALLRAAGFSEPAANTNVLQDAIAFIQARQLPTGGWSYGNARGDLPNSSLSVWQLLTLNLARECNIPVDQDALARGQTWLRSVVNGHGQFGYHQRNDRPAESDTLTAMGALCLFRGGDAEHPNLRPIVRTALRRVLASAPESVDFYRWYFVAAAVAADPKQLRERELTPLHTALVGSHIPTGEFAGSWPLTDRWSRVGGRVYTTGMAAMTLLPPTDRPSR